VGGAGGRNRKIVPVGGVGRRSAEFAFTILFSVSPEWIKKHRASVSDLELWILRRVLAANMQNNDGVTC
jgi:hypothetical protein